MIAFADKNELFTSIFIHKFATLFVSAIDAITKHKTEKIKKPIQIIRIDFGLLESRDKKHKRAHTGEKSIDTINALLPEIESVCNCLLIANGFTYTASAKIDRENFPTRTYDNVTLKAGVYDALIIELGSGRGDNWWCIVYPPLCFVNKSDIGAHNIQYQSYLMEIVRKYFNKR